MRFIFIVLCEINYCDKLFLLFIFLQYRRNTIGQLGCYFFSVQGPYLVMSCGWLIDITGSIRYDKLFCRDGPTDILNKR